MSQTVILGLIPLVVPILLWGLKGVVPLIPKFLLPILAPLLGAALEWIGYYAGVTSGNPVLGAVLGAAGVGLREVIDQIKRTLPV